MNVMIFGDRLFSKDMAWGFAGLSHQAQTAFPKTVQETDACLSSEPDLLITVGSPAYFAPAVLERIGQRPVPSMKCVHWDTDGITWANIEMKMIQTLQPDYVFTICPEMLALLKAKGIPSDLLFYAYSPLTHHPGSAAAEYADQIAFVGAAYPTVIAQYPHHYRRRSLDTLFKPLLDGGYRVDFYGDNDHRQVIKSLFGFDLPNNWLHERQPYEDTWRIYHSCAINLVTQNNEHSLTKRTFEILGSGGFALSYGNDAIRQLFVPGRDLVVSSSPKQTLELVEYYVQHPDARNLIRSNALISIRNHTYLKRAECIVSRVKTG